MGSFLSSPDLFWWLAHKRYQRYQLLLDWNPKS